MSRNSRRPRRRGFFQNDDYMGGKEIDLSQATDKDRWDIMAFNNSEDQREKQYQAAKSKADAYRQQHGFDQYGNRPVTYGKDVYAGMSKKERRDAKVHPMAGMSDKEKKRYKQQNKFMQALRNKEKQAKERYTQTKLGKSFDYSRRQFDADGMMIRD